jgi:hypothetical protein
MRTSSATIDLSEVCAQYLGWEDMLQRHSTDLVRSIENRNASKNKGLLSADKVLFVGVKW